MRSLLYRFSKDEIAALVESGFTFTKKSLRHREICDELAKGTTHEKIAEMFGLCDDSHVRAIQRKHCPECR